MRFAFILSILSVFVFVTADADSSHGKTVVCSVIEEPLPGFFHSKQNEFNIANVNLNLCTHLIYIHLISYVYEKPWHSTDAYNLENYKQITGLKKLYPHLKISLGFEQSPSEFLKIATHRETHRRFTTSAVNFILRSEFDGLNFIWSSEHDEPFGKKRFVHFVKELKESFQPHNLLITSTFIKTKDLIQSHGLLAMSNYFDFMHVQPNHIQILMGLGASQSKIIPIIEFTARGYLSYNDICELSINNGTSNLERKWDPKIGASIARQIGKKDHIIPSSRSIANAVRNAVRQNFTGLMVYTIDSDDSVGKCGNDMDTFDDFKPAKGVVLNIPKRNNSHFPLFNTVNDAIVVAVDEMAQEAKINNL